MSDLIILPHFAQPGYFSISLGIREGSTVFNNTIHIIIVIISTLYYRVLYIKCARQYQKNKHTNNRNTVENFVSIKRRKNGLIPPELFIL